jgi:carboxyl-terminal processing protease
MKMMTQSVTLVSVMAVSVGLYGAESAPVADSGLTEAGITRATANLLERGQFSQRLVDARLSSHFLDQYPDALDGAYLLILKCEMDEFARFRSDLAQVTSLGGETRPAPIMYARYLKRLAQQVDFETCLLHTAKFNFTGDDSWQADRREAPPPLDLAAAKRLRREDVREDYLREKLAGTPTVEIAPTLARRCEGRLQTMLRLKADEVLGIYLDSLAHADGPHSDYFRNEEWENFKIEMKLSLVGVGATVQAKNGYCVITDLVPGSPAERSGLLKPGDRIVAVAQGYGEPVDIVDMPPSQAAELLRGPKGSTVCLTVIPVGAGDSTCKVVSPVREEINLANEHASASIIDLPLKGSSQLRIGVIDLPSFYGTGDEKTGASADTARLIKRLKKDGVLGLLLD